MSVNVTKNSPSWDYPHPDDQTTQTSATPGFKPFTKVNLSTQKRNAEPIGFDNITAVINYLVLCDTRSYSSMRDRRLQQSKLDCASRQGPKRNWKGNG